MCIVAASLVLYGIAMYVEFILSRHKLTYAEKLRVFHTVNFDQFVTFSLYVF